MGKSDLRSQLKATSIKKLRKIVDEEDSKLGSGSTNEYLSLEDGKTIKIRIFPAHPGGENFYISKKCYWLSVEGNDGEMRRTQVLDSRMHGGTKMDIVDEYVKAAKKKWSKDTKRMEALTGTGPKSDSLNPTYSWICYADRVSGDDPLRAKLWEFRKTVRDALNKLAFSEDEDEAIEIDPFTDPDEGLPVLVKYLKNPNRKKGENYYEVSFAKKPVARPLTDDEIEYFMELKPLAEVLVPYGMRDFERALEGLRNFDDLNDIGMFDDDDWLEKVEEVKAQYDDEEDEKPKRKTVKKRVEIEDDEEDDEEEKPAKRKVVKKPVDDEEDDEEEDEKPAPKKSSKKPVDDEEEDDEEEPAPKGKPADDDEEDDEQPGDELDALDRAGLKTYIREHDLNVPLKRSMSEDDIRASIRAEEARMKEAAAFKKQMESTDAAGDDDEEEDDDEPSARISLDDIRKKLASNKK